MAKEKHPINCRSSIKDSHIQGGTRRNKEEMQMKPIEYLAKNLLSLEGLG